MKRDPKYRNIRVCPDARIDAAGRYIIRYHVNCYQHGEFMRESEYQYLIGAGTCMPDYVLIEVLQQTIRLGNSAALAAREMLKVILEE